MRITAPCRLLAYTFSMQLQIPDRPSLSLDQPRLMGILNVTPDSFSDGGRFVDTSAAVQQGLAMAAAGAAVLDVGGESTRPGAERLSVDEQISRVQPVIRMLRERLDAQGLGHVVISIDTTRREVAAAAVKAGAGMLNDVTAGGDDPGMFTLAAEHGLPLALMHMQGTPATMQDSPTYIDVVAEVRQFLLDRAAAAEQAGVARQQIVIDPGLGFGKAVEHNLALLAHLETFVATGYPVLLGQPQGFHSQGEPADHDYRG